MGHVLTNLVGDLTEVRSLNFDGDPNQRAPESIPGRREQHLLFDLGSIGRPDESDQ